MNIREFVEKNPKLVTHRQSERYPGLYVVKYTRKVFYDALWCPELEECRGLVVDQDWNPVIIPFKKIYNRGENDTDFLLTDYVTAVRKINGFMAAATYVEGHHVVISTTGSLDSPFVTIAEKHLRPVVANYVSQYPGYTFLFEICDEEDPHIIKEVPGSYLIGMRDHVDGSLVSEALLDHHAHLMHVHRPLRVEVPFKEIVKGVKNVQHEGYVVTRWYDDKVLKIKSPYYLVTKFLARLKSEKFLERIDQPEIRQTIDEEYYPLLDFLSLNKNFFANLDEQNKIDFIRKYLSK